jgi:hypothetical protein
MQPSVLSWKVLYAWGASAMGTAWVVRSTICADPGNLTAKGYPPRRRRKRQAIGNRSNLRSNRPDRGRREGPGRDPGMLG